MASKKRKDVNQLAKSLIDKVIERSETEQIKLDKNLKKNLAPKATKEKE
jgi:hypothetical protein